MADPKNPFEPGEASLEVPAERLPDVGAASPEEAASIPATERVLLSSYSSLIEAEMMASALRGSGIAVSLSDQQTVAANALLGVIVGVKLFVHTRDVERAQAILAKPRGAGKPVFAVEAKRILPLVAGMAGGTVAGLVLALVVGFPAVAIIGVAGGAFLGSRTKPWLHCSTPSCAAKLEFDTKTCPGCGGIVSGIIKNANDRLEAEESLRERSREQARDRAD